MCETRKDLQELAAELSATIHLTRRLGFTATAQAMAQVQRELEMVATKPPLAPAEPQI
ncbi:hypothetical protein DEA8626_03460 [Defluviimonas aquaemixtae]|uniref:Uncharacterized protein n=1 Tax=Albidovulum aquaemixtae TaxID=1542388 RepID=A0A2R8BLW1_9RHOB|nr:hypothetical protein DEA8626_03445 [Defluviimonas aquaemixtae]SPH24396.1 hypothetical protein DEA8626_03448 [Defluviimonas aquaemixtae]SPH24408.1 hypothetical protein DEA8626_03460 [Defluviimonas aquaemixtae]